MKKGMLYFILAALASIVGYACASRGMENTRDFR
jgi:hypothetical protein